MRGLLRHFGRLPRGYSLDHVAARGQAEVSSVVDGVEDGRIQGQGKGDGHHKLVLEQIGKNPPVQPERRSDVELLAELASEGVDFELSRARSESVVAGEEEN